MVEESSWACGETRLGSGRGLNRTVSIGRVLLLQSVLFFFKKKRLKEVSGWGAGTL